MHVGSRKFLKNLILAFFHLIIDVGLDGYLFLMIFLIASVGFAKIILKLCGKPDFKYINILIFCSIGLVFSLILKLIKFNLQFKFFESLLCIGVNTVIFLLLKHIKKQRDNENIS